MKKLIIAAVAAVLGVGLLFVVGVLGSRIMKQHIAPSIRRQSAVHGEPAPAAPLPASVLEVPPSAEGDRGFIYARVTMTDGATYQGRLRFGDGHEAFWGDTFSGVKKDNPWLAQLKPAEIPKQSHSVEIFGWKLGEHTRTMNVTRLLTARFGEIAKLEAVGRLVRVTLKSGSVVDVDSFNAGDIDDDVRVWDPRGVMELDSTRISSIEMLPTRAVTDAPARLHGTVRSRQGDFTGFIVWNWDQRVGDDELDGRDAEGVEQHVRFDTTRSIENKAHNRALVVLQNGRELELSGASDVSDKNRGILVDDPRFGRVVFSWRTFERVDFSPADSGPGYDDYPAGTNISGTVTTRDGKKLTGRIVYDLDESETTDMLDGSFDGVDYHIPFGMVASIVPSEDHPTRVTLRNGKEVQLEWDGDVGKQNAGELVFVGGTSTYIPWANVARVDFDPPKGERPL
ncbi:MAG TPA: hypothetical protein VJ826_15530 [Candidatus Polarisedimenticolaceae bacterium]|nr:hypothetical protein [Candidatus Polarisedimenticolaceae bacterium]